MSSDIITNSIELKNEVVTDYRQKSIKVHNFPFTTAVSSVIKKEINLDKIDGKVYIGNEDGELLVFEAAKKKRVIHTAKFSAPIYSSVVVANKALYVTTLTHLYKIEEMGQTSP